MEYARVSAGVRILDQQVVSSSCTRPIDAAEALAAAMRLAKGEGARLAMAIRGLGSEHLIVTLPPADDAVLRPVVGRELYRVYPDLQQPVFEFARGGSIDRRARARPAEQGQPRQEILIGAVPGEVARELDEVLTRHGISLDHLTVLPQALQQLYSEVDGSNEPTGVVFALPGGPLIGFFQEGELRFVVDSLLSFEPAPAEALESILEQLERGSLYLRQTFRGAAMNRVLVSADPSGAEVMAALEARLGITVRIFGSEMRAPEALIALGAVRDAESPAPINLSPRAESRVVRVRRSQERTLMLVADVVMALAIVWAVLTVWSVKELSARVAADVAQVQRVAPQVAHMRAVAESRRDYIREATYLDSLAADRAAVQRVLAAIGVIGRSEVQVEQIRLTRAAVGWAADLVAVSTGPSTAGALFGVDRFYRALPVALGTGDRQLVELTYVPASEGGTTSLRFHITFTFHSSPVVQ